MLRTLLTTGAVAGRHPCRVARGGETRVSQLSWASPNERAAVPAVNHGQVAERSPPSVPVAIPNSAEPPWAELTANAELNVKRTVQIVTQNHRHQRPNEESKVHPSPQR